MKLLDFVKKNEHLLNKDNVFVVLDDKNKAIMHYAIYRKDDLEKAVYLYHNIFVSIKLTKIQDDEIAPFYKKMEINENNVINISREEFVQVHKKSIKESLKNDNSENFKHLISFMNKNAGSLCRDIAKNSMFIGITSTDEDFYYLFVQNDNGKVKFHFSSCCGSIDIIDKKDYTKEDYDLIKFVKANKYEILRQIDLFESEVMINGVNFGDNFSYKKYKDTSLSTILNLYRHHMNKDTKCIDILEDILNNLDDDRLNSIVISLLNKVIQEYYHFYNPLPTELKKYYYESFYNKVKSKIDYGCKKIYNDKVRSYVRNVCKTLNKEFIKKN